MPTRHVRTQVSAVVVFVAVFLTAGCATGTENASPSATAGTVSADGDQAPTAVESTPAVAPVVGQMFAKGEEPSFLAPDQHLYEVYDAKGDYTGAVLFANGQPLPAPVQEAIVAPVKAAFDAATAVGAGGPAALGDNGVWTDEQAAAADQILPRAMARAASASKATGRHIVLVYTNYGNVGQVWEATTGDTPISNSSSQSKETTLARAQAWAAEQADPAAYEVVAE